jgi:GTPase
MRSGFAVLLGRPNVGKSTLLNALVGAEISIATPKPQTTRDAIQGVLTESRGQIIFVDSPGIHEPSLELGKRMMTEVRRATSGCHVVLLVVDVTEPEQEGDRAAIEMIKELKLPVILLLNKVDLLRNKEEILPQIDAYRQRLDFAEIVPVSGRKSTNLDLLLGLIFNHLPESPNYYPDDYLTDQPERFLAAELIREQIIMATSQEIPYSTAVVIDHWEESPALLRLAAIVFVERQGQKAILIGARGLKMKEIGTRARKQIEARFGRKVFLELFVKVHPRWRDSTGFVSALDFRRMVGHEMPFES